MHARSDSLLLTFSLVLLAACGSDDDPVDPGGGSPGDDTTPPATVTDLQVVDYDEDRALLRWTAPGDDGGEGTAAAYEIGYSPTPITAASWSACTMLGSCPVPTPAGSEQSARIDTPPAPGLYVALRAVDDAGNWSGISNVAHGQIAGTFDVIQLTHEGNNRYPCLDDGFVTWVGTREVGMEEIWIAGLGGVVATPSVLTDNGGEKMQPSSHGREKIVWMGRGGPGEDWEIWVYSLTSVPRFRQFTDNAIPDLFPAMAGGGDFAWQQGYTVHEEVRYFDEASHDQFSLSDTCCPTSDYANGPIGADDGVVVWSRWHRTGSDPTRFFRWDGAVRDITDDIDGGMSLVFSLDRGELAYEWGTRPRMIRYWDGVTVRDIAEGYHPSLDDGWIAFEAWDGHDWEIHLWDGVNEVAITDNDFYDADPTLSGDVLAWSGRPSGSGGLYQIFYTRLPGR